MSAHLAVPPTVPGRVTSLLVDETVFLLAVTAALWARLHPVLAAVWRASWPTLLALLVGLYIVIGGLALADAGHQDLAMWGTFVLLLADAVAVSWVHTGRDQ